MAIYQIKPDSENDEIKMPTLTFEDAEMEIPENLNFLEKEQVKSSIHLARRNYIKQRD